MQLTNLKEIIDKRRISIGVQEANLKEAFKKLKKVGITSLKEAEDRLNKIETTLDELSKEERKIEVDVERVLEANG